MNPGASLEERLRRVEEALSHERARARRRARWAWGLAAATCVLAAAAAVADPAAAVPCNSARSASLYCFAANAPALASSVNSNFETITRWIESKVGPINPATPEAAPTGTGGLVVIGNAAAAHLALDGDELDARSGTAASTLYLQEGASAGDTSLNSSSGRVFVGGAGPSTTAKLQVNGVVAANGLLVGAGGTAMTKILTGTHGTCSTSGGTPSTGTVNFTSTFTNVPLVFLSVEEQDSSGCTSARTTARTTSSFSYQAWVGGGASNCDCIHWVAIGQ